MNRKRILSIGAGCVGLLLTFAPAARPDAWDKKTTVNFSQSVEVPGTVLQPGRYVMKLVDLPSDRHVVQFLNDRENHVYATAMAVPTFRDRVADHSVFTFYEAPAGQPEAMKAWYYPGDNYGQEFMYPKSRAIQLASYRSIPATSLSDRTENARSITSRSITSNEIAQPATQDKVETQVTPSESNASNTAVDTPTTESHESPVVIAQNNTPATPAPAPAATDNSSALTNQNSLPKTSTHIVEFGLLGLLSLAGAGSIRVLRRTTN